MSPIISVTLPSDGQSADASDINDPINAILAVVNGALDDDNIASLSGTKILAGTLPQSAFNAATNLGWKTDSIAVSAVTYLGNGSYSLTRATSIKAFKSVGMRNRYTRTVTAPTQSTSLNGTTQYWEKTTPNKMTWTDDFAVGRWIYLTAYPAAGTSRAIESRYNGTSGWVFDINEFGQIRLSGYNAGAANVSYVISQQSVPLNEPVWAGAQLDMSAFTATPTTSYTMIAGMDVAATVIRGGTNPVALVQAGNYQIGASNALSFFPGKLGPGFVSGVKVTQANMRTIYGQGITATDVTNLAIATAINFNGTAIDVNTTTPNDMTAVAAAGYTADSPFAGGASTVNLSYTAGTTEMSVTTAISNDGLTETVQVPEGYALPTSGGISASSYSREDAYGFPNNGSKFDVEAIFKASSGAISIGAINTWVTSGRSVTFPIGAYKEIGFQGVMQLSSSVSGERIGAFLLDNVTPTNGSFAYTRLARFYQTPSALNLLGSCNVSYPETLSAQSVFTLYAQIDGASGVETFLMRGDQGTIIFFGKFAYV